MGGCERLRGKVEGTDDRWIGENCFRFTGFLYDSCNVGGVVSFLFWGRIKDDVIPSNDEERSEHRSWWTVMNWFGLEINREVSEINVLSSFAQTSSQMDLESYSFAILDEWNTLYHRFLKDCYGSKVEEDGARVFLSLDMGLGGLVLSIGPLPNLHTTVCVGGGFSFSLIGILLD
ncbi:hypothetical protein V6N13_140292 [Hibiscus sabdariffa]|uniref:Uncharacterized protein n=1 Tax=Hibiscus sabdariffa TaxID=183260 RepID=A0ABR2QAJ0_9ROSI